MSNDDETDPNRSRGGGDEETSNIAASFGKYSSSSSASSTSSSSSSCSSSSTTPVNDSVAADETESGIVEEIYADLIEDVTFGLILQTHRAAKLGYLQLVDPDSDSELDKQYEIYDDADVLGVFKSNANETTSTKSSSSYKNGQNSSSALLKYECVCPNCGRNLAAIRFAPHLEKCMGMGRNSSRIATRRIANGGGSGFGAMTDYELDQLIESTGMIPNPRYFEQFNKPAPPPPAPAPTPTPAPAAAPAAPHSSSESDLISIINAVATDSNNIHPSSSCSSLIEIDVSSSSSGSSLHNHPSAHHHHHQHHPHQHTTTTNIAAGNTFKMPVAKKKKLNNSRSLATSSAATSSQNTRSASGQSSSSTSYGSIFTNK